VPELEENIFQIIDDILNKQINNSIKKINIILNEINIYALYNNLLANLRTSVYIFKLKKLNKSVSEISKTLNLGNKTFLINKKYKINYNEIQRLYINLVNIDKKMKS
jgi:DNA polymerase III delta subunit